MVFQKYSKYTVLILITIVFVLLTAGSASAYEGCRNGTDVDHNYTTAIYTGWNITNGTVTCSNMGINVTGNVTINNGSTLILSNVTLAFNDTVHGAVNKSVITVFNGSTLHVLASSNITVTDTAIGNVSYSILSYNTSITYINDSTIEYIANETISNEVYGFESNGFLEIYNSTIQNARNYALRVNGSGTTGFKMTYTNVLNNGRGIILYNTTVLSALLNNNISATTEDFQFETNYTNVLLQNTTVNITKTFSSTADYINISWPVSFRIRNSYGNSDGALLLSSANVSTMSSENSSYANNSFLTDTNGLTTATYFFSYKKNSGTLYTYGNYSVNVTNSLGTNFSDNLTANYYYNVTSASDGILALNLTVYEVFNNVSLARNVNSSETSAGSFANITMVLNNTGNGGDPANWTMFNLSNNVSGLGIGDWAIEFTNNTINMSNGSSQTVRGRITIPSTATPNGTYVFNISATAYIQGRGGVARSDSFIFTLQINNSTNGINYGWSVQNATNWLNINLSSEDGEWGAWNRSNYTSAWGLWAYAQTYGVNTSLIYNVTSWFNFSQDAAGYWTDNKYDTNVTTSLVILAYKNNDYADAPGAANNYTNITRAVEYLQLQGSFDDASYNCWPNSSCDAYNTSIILSSLMKASTTNTNLTQNATGWLTDNQSSDGSWNNNLTHTSWALYALGSANSTYTGLAPNLSNSANWIQNQQQIEGYFGDSGNILDTALAVIALQAGGNESWTVDVDQNTTTTNDQYAGSIKLALDWILTQQESNGGWGTSPANALGSGLGLLAIGNYTTLSGTITGAGYAPGFILENTTVTLGTYNTTVNNIGEYVLNAPAGSGYALTTTHDTFETNSTNTSVSMPLGSNKTQDLTMLPSLEIVGDAYGALNFYSIVSNDWSTGATYAINGTARYTYNTSQIVPANFTLSSDPGASGFSIGSTAFNRSFGISSKGAPSPSSTTPYTLTLSVTDDFGVSATSTHNISVVGGGEDSDTPAAVSGSSGTPAAGVDYSMSVTSYDSQVSVIQGEKSTTKFTIKNNGNKRLEGIKLEIIGIPVSWYNIEVSTSGLSNEDLASGESVTFDIEFTPPADAEPKSYTITIKAKDTGGEVIQEKKVTFKVTKVWDTTKIATLKGDIENVKKELSGAEGEVTVLKAKGVDITSIESDITAFSTAIQNAIAKYNAGEYTASETYFKEAQDLLEKINKAIAAAKPPEKKIGRLLEGISLGVVSIVIIAILVGGFVGFILWYKLFRVIPISEIKKDPDLFAEGARIEGVVKSITETKKGKVFLIQDHTEKLHVRYPYYTTIGEDNLIRAVGNIKTYKDVPYMDASDIHRVTVKHFGSFKKSGRLHKPASNFLKRFKRK